MARGDAMKHRGTLDRGSPLSRAQIGKAREIARKEQNRPGSTVGRHIPDRGTLDFEGNTFSGLDRMKIASQTLTEAEQATNSTDSRVLASGNTNPERAVDTGHIKDGAVTPRTISGTIDKGNLPDVDKLNGTVKAKDASWADGKDFVPNDAIKGVSWDKVSGTPNFVKDSDVNDAVADVKQWVKNHYRKK